MTAADERRRWFNYMSMSRRRLLAGTFMSAAGLYRPAALFSASSHSFGIEAENFVLHGKPFQILSGEMHYPRVPRSWWRDRMRKARALGLNTICTYVFWNAHETRPGEFEFTGNLDVASYIRTAQQEGLWVILRPGPYVCAEWDFGGYPAWLLEDPDLRVRTSDPKFLRAAARYLNRVGQELAPLQITHGGPIILCQVENEYGSYGEDHEYMQTIRRMITDAGFDVTLDTADGSEFLKRGNLPGTLSAVNFGASDDVTAQFERLEHYQPKGPRMCGEYWEGWFDHWGETHHTVSVKAAATPLEWMLSRKISVNIYMLHGGTTFGFMPGANTAGPEDKLVYQPDISSYDYDALLDEAGRPTPKYFAVQQIIRRYLPEGTTLPDLPAPERAITIPRFELSECAPLFSLLHEPRTSRHPLSMAELRQSYGMVLYRKRMEKPFRGELRLNGFGDYAVCWAKGRYLGTLYDGFREQRLSVELNAGEDLNILVDAMGHVNYGPHLGQDRKGLTGGVALGGEVLQGGENYPLPLISLSGLQFGTEYVSGPAFYRAQFEVAQPGFAFLDMRDWGKGYVWVNGHNLGRYWSIGPQRSLYVPAEWLHSGPNEILVLDLHPSGTDSVEAGPYAIYDLAAMISRK